MKHLSTLKSFHRYPWWKRLKICWLEDHFSYPVVYEDGLVSQRKTDLLERKPLGIMFEEFVIFLSDDEKKMEPCEAKDYCSSLSLGGISGVVPSWALLNTIKCERSEIDSLLVELGGKPFEDDWYLSLGYNLDDEFSCIHLIYPSFSIYYPDPKSKIRVRPVFFLSI